MKERNSSVPTDGGCCCASAHHDGLAADHGGHHHGEIDWAGKRLYRVMMLRLPPSLVAKQLAV